MSLNHIQRLVIYPDNDPSLTCHLRMNVIKVCSIKNQSRPVFVSESHSAYSTQLKQHSNSPILLKRVIEHLEEKKKGKTWYYRLRKQPCDAKQQHQHS